MILSFCRSIFLKICKSKKSSSINTNLIYTRKFDAVFIEFPELIKQGTVGEIQIYYSGNPQLPDIASLSGGFIWVQDKNGKPWIETVVQGSGASLWWPCKDHLSDKPDSMHITVTVPSGLSCNIKRAVPGEKNIAG